MASCWPLALALTSSLELALRSAAAASSEHLPRAARGIRLPRGKGRARLFNAACRACSWLICHARQGKKRDRKKNKKKKESGDYEEKERLFIEGI